MKPTTFGLFTLLSLAGPLCAAEPTSPPPAASTPTDKPKEKENPLHLPPAKRAAAGLVLAKPTSATLAPEISGYGRVLDPIPFVTLVAELATARAAALASEQDLTRAQKLFSAGANASAQSVEAATATATRDRIAVASARARLLASWGRALAEAGDLALTVDALEKGYTLARVDFLLGDTPASDAKTLRIGLVGRDELTEAEILGAAPTADPQLAGLGFLVVIKTRALPVGVALRAIVAAPGAAETALTVPTDAVVYHQGSAWIYVLEEEDTFERKLVTLGRTVGHRVVIRGAVEESEQVVTTGAQQLLSAELQAGGAPEEK